MTITMEELNQFIREHGSVSMVDIRGTTRRLEGDSRDSYDLFESAERIFYGGQWYSRLEFKQVLEESIDDYYNY